MAGKGSGRKRKRARVTSPSKEEEEEECQTAVEPDLSVEARRARMSEELHKLFPDPNDYAGNYQGYRNAVKSIVSELFLEVHKTMMGEIAKIRVVEGGESPSPL